MFAVFVTTTVVLLAVLVWFVIGLRVAAGLEPKVARVAIMVNLAALAWPLQIIGARRLRASMTKVGLAPARTANVTGRDTE